MKMFLYHFTVAFSIFSCFSGYNCSKNIALNRPAESDSVYSSSWGPDKAVDGDANQNLFCNSCLHTKGDGSTAFLKIIFQSASSINRVEIFYRRPYSSSGCSQNPGGGFSSNNRFKGYRIEIEGITCYQDTSEPYPELYQNNRCRGTGSYLRIVQVNSSPNDNNPILEICEAIVHGCPTKMYGANCSQECPNCLNGTCDPDTGDCWNGCKPGWQGTRCQDACSNQTFGLKCAATCRCYNDANCNHINGSCPNGLCDTGWKGESCQEVCPDYYYGDNCTQRCHNCKNNVKCHHINGTCPEGCMDGYSGDKCDRVCPVGSYGPDCSLTCGNCFNDLCHNIDGLCQQGCERGYKGIYCKTACDDGSYGFNCIATCGNCRDNAICDKVSGDCPEFRCEDGFKGTLCKDQCSDLEYGPNCREKCGECKDGHHCNTVNGTCIDGCNDGYLGAKCYTVCPSGMYGKNCSLSCTSNCLGTCDHVSGFCLKGCKDGYRGTLCMEGITSSTEMIIGVVSSIIIFGLIAIIVFFIIFVRRRKRPQGKENESNVYENEVLGTMPFKRDDGTPHCDDRTGGKEYVETAYEELDRVARKNEAAERTYEVPTQGVSNATEKSYETLGNISGTSDYEALSSNTLCNENLNN